MTGPPLLWLLGTGNKSQGQSQHTPVSFLPDMVQTFVSPPETHNEGINKQAYLFLLHVITH